MALLRYWTLLHRYLWPQRAKLFVLAGLLFGGIGLQLINPQILRYFIDAARAGSSLQQLSLAAGLFLGVALVAYLVAIAATAVGGEVGWLATSALRADLVAHCLRLDLGFHHAHTPGELIERVDSDVRALAHLFSQLVLRVFGNLLLLIGVLVALWLVDWPVGFLCSLFVGGALFVLVHFRTVGVAAWETAREADATLYGFVEERIGGTVDLRANGAVGYVLQQFARAQQASFAAEFHAWRRIALPRNALRVLLNFASALTLGLGGWSARQGALSVGTVALIYAYTATLFAPLTGLGRELEELQDAIASIMRVDELMRTQSNIPDGTERLPLGALAVSFAGVTFGYDSTVPVLRDLSLQLAAGRTLGLLGRTGSGKTTVSRLMLRLYLPQAGDIRIGDQDIRALQRVVLRERVGVVTQEVHLFAATVRDNVTFFDSTIPDERVLAALETLDLGDWCRALPAGLDTMLTPGGGGLSAGEGQLLALTRIFLREPGLVILDEPSSRLDPATEVRVARALDRVLAGRTAIIIAHRLETVRRVDDILILEEGRIREYGPRARLAADPNSVFARLLQLGHEGVLS